MPAKPCPSCGLKNPASATNCDCGHGFTGNQLVVAEQRLCPTCRWVNAPSATECRCGHSFTEANEELRDALTHQLTASWLTVAGGLMLVVGGIAAAVLQVVLGLARIWVPTGLVITGVGLTLKGGRDVSRARSRIDALGARPIEPPRAWMLKK